VGGNKYSTLTGLGRFHGLSSPRAAPWAMHITPLYSGLFVGGLCWQSREPGRALQRPVRWDFFFSYLSIRRNTFHFSRFTFHCCRRALQRAVRWDSFLLTLSSFLSLLSVSIRCFRVHLLNGFRGTRAIRGGGQGLFSLSSFLFSLSLLIPAPPVYGIGYTV